MSTLERNTLWVGWMWIQPTKLMFFEAVHGAVVRLAHLPGDKDVNHKELVIAQLASKCLNAPVTVGFRNGQDP